MCIWIYIYICIYIRGTTNSLIWPPTWWFYCKSPWRDIYCCQATANILKRDIVRIGTRLGFLQAIFIINISILVKTSQNCSTICPDDESITSWITKNNNKRYLYFTSFFRPSEKLILLYWASSSYDSWFYNLIWPDIDTEYLSFPFCDENVEGNVCRSWEYHKT